MKKVAINLQDLVDVLEAMRDSNGTTDVIFFEYNGMPALADKEEPDNVITFQVYDKTEETKDGDIVH